jgi:hypothetical protein
MSSRITLAVDYDDRQYEIDATVRHHVGLTNRSADRAELFAEIDRTVAKVKAAIGVSE